MAPHYTGVPIRNARARPGPTHTPCIHVSVTTALVTTTSHANKSHSSRCSAKSRRPQSPRSWHGSNVGARTILPGVQAVRGQRRARTADHKARAAHSLRSAPRPRRIPPPRTSCRGSPTGFVRSCANSRLSGPVDKNRTTAGEHDTEHWVQAMWMVRACIRVQGWKCVLIP